MSTIDPLLPFLIEAHAAKIIPEGTEVEVTFHNTMVVGTIIEPKEFKRLLLAEHGVGPVIPHNVDRENLQRELDRAPLGDYPVIHLRTNSGGLARVRLDAIVAVEIVKRS